MAVQELMNLVKKYLVVRADGDVRVLTKLPKLGYDEIGFRVNVSIPEAWGTVVGDIDIEMPEPDLNPTVQIEDLKKLHAELKSER